jgi:hypothetical protein
MKTSKLQRVTRYFGYILLCAVFSCTQIENKLETKKEKIERLGYDFEKDAYINSILDQKPIFKKTEYGTTTIRFEQLQIEVTHYKKIPYKQIESWYISCNDINGEMILLQSSIGIAKHNVSKATLDRIKKMCP